jgi:hypothetical protein
VRPAARGALVLCAAVGLGAAWFWSHRRAPEVRAAAPAVAEGSAEGLDERQLLRDEVRRLGLENAKLRAAQAPAPEVADAGAAAAAVPTRPATPESESKWLLARAAKLDEALAAQPRNEEWASSLEKRARAVAAAKAEAGVTLLDVRCRSTACRMEYSYPSGEARLAHIHGLAKDFGELPRVSYAYPGEPETHTRAIMYLTDEAHPLPLLDYATYAAANP